ncbi:hypothetical protein GUITHDRAFT_99015 [Guillardia theta CCMP2712]|uniref:EGF-like domain-containing protein n=3 Tax=Guillardia theta TaxID=55529 RepID=L1K3R0_GUITC|nr:hypothetical protein GUITHDRAFT_99015 [Guillardia theta CCMP2712]EKX55234.1 hypothetical protein GUITHDRAFT_99015 [Guillardia theta CCMP2712]|eukprot:XP_005842214.1 hypothetical protein GUITHDRAFT_99015 [Guillardia theta CCMP2712]
MKSHRSFLDFIALTWVLLSSYCVPISSQSSYLPVHSVQPWPTAGEGGAIQAAADGDWNTNWVANPCRSGSWRMNSVFNALFNACADGLCSGSCDCQRSELQKATDNSQYTGATIEANHAAGMSWAIFPLSTGPERLVSVYIRGIWAVDTKLYVFTEDQEKVLLRTLQPSDSYNEIMIYNLPNKPIRSIHINVASRDGRMLGYCYAGVGDCITIVVTEIAAQRIDCFEQVTMDLGDYFLISSLQADFSGSTRANLSFSTDGNNFWFVQNIVDNVIKGYTSDFVPNVTARFASVRFETDPSSVWTKVYVKDIKFFGKNASKESCFNGCSGHGTCTASQESSHCECESGYGGIDCSFPSCSVPCENGGQCVAGRCKCLPGFAGTNCNQTLCPSDCSGHGVCSDSMCICEQPFSGADCRYVTYNVSGHSISVLNYSMLIKDEARKDPHLTSFYKSQESSRCPPSQPFLCNNSACVKTLGECALMHATDPPDWNPASYVPVPLTRLNSTTASTSSQPSDSGKVIDGNDGSGGFWQSGTCYPTGYVGYAEVNILLHACEEAGRCNSSTSGSLAAATDGSTSSAASVSAGASGQAWLEVSLQSASALVAITIKVTSSASTQVVVKGKDAGGSWVSLATTSSSYTVADLRVGSGAGRFVAIRLESSSSMNVFELSARSGPCMEYATVSFETVQTVSAISIRHWAGSTAGVNHTVYETSLDGETWKTLRDGVDPYLIGALDTALEPGEAMRYIRVRHVLEEGVAMKVYVWEITAWGEAGRWGEKPPVRENAVDFRDLLGVNGIWGWSRSMYSSSIPRGEGLWMYKNMSRHGRNYHNWNWDVPDPDIVPPFSDMVARGSTDYGENPGHSSKLNQDWLNWDIEYTTWKAVLKDVITCIQFTSDMFPQRVWDSPYLAAYRYGFAFAKHFGRSSGTGDVSTLEVGNEPWMVQKGYEDPRFYSDILLGMARGAKEADPLMRVLPATFAGASDTLSRINQTHIKYLDGLNTHLYSYVQTTVGRKGVHPEHPMSSIHAADWMFRFRDRNAPGLPIYLTEYGWDSAGGGETCDPPAERATDPPFPECVSERSQAIYAVRGALVLARKGYARLTWFFYGNSAISLQDWDRTKGLFSRSGLVSSGSAGYQEKMALRALEIFVETLGSKRFLGVVREDSSAYVYELGDAGGRVTHLAGWLPIDGEEEREEEVSFEYGGAPSGEAWRLGSDEYVKATAPSWDGQKWTVKLSVYVYVVALNFSRLDCALCVNGNCVNGTCVCDKGFEGPGCDRVSCPNSCWQRGTCQANGTCICDKYLGADGQGLYQLCQPEDFYQKGNCRDSPIEFDPAHACEIVRCPNNCNGHGECTKLGCVCNVGWSGDHCDQQPCPYNCRSHGVCTNGSCVCRQGFVGDSCEWPDQFLPSQVCDNSHPVLCNNGICSKSRGECALMHATDPPDWNPASYVPVPLTRLNSTTASTSSQPSDSGKVIDGNDGSGGFWQSGTCYPTGYVGYAEVNILLHACEEAGRCNSTSGSLAAATDGSTSSAASVSAGASGQAWLEVSLQSASALVAITIKVTSSASTQVVVKGKDAGGSWVSLATTSSSYTVADLRVGSGAGRFVAIRLESSSSMNVFELSARSGPCMEYATVSFETVQTVSAISIRHWAGSTAGVNHTVYETSLDGETWKTLRDGVDPYLIGALDTALEPGEAMRYIRVRHVLEEGVAMKVYVWEITAWGEAGRWGEKPPVRENAVDFGDLLGVNGIWAWGGQGWSNLARDGWGPRRYTKMAKHGRNYHNWNWDVPDPDVTPDYEKMSCGLGTNALWWLDWSWEYPGWKAADLEVHTCLQFTSDMFPQRVWDSPYLAAYRYGFAFAKHFGRSSGTGDVSTLEVGNEPWMVQKGYEDPRFYSDILLGMARGAKEADPLMRVLPATFAGASDTLSRINQTHIKYLDGLNTHLYSYVQTTVGRKGVHPEHPMSSIHAADWMFRFRDRNAPGLPIYLTEYGWDSAGGGETCDPPAERATDPPFPECVSERSQAIYAVRGALVLARKGYARLTWFFYGNSAISLQDWDRTKGLFSRSGLVSSGSAGYQEKMALRALEIFVETLGSKRFLGVVREDSSAYVYELGDAGGRVTHLAGWLPIDGEEEREEEVSFEYGGAPSGEAWRLGSDEYVKATAPSWDGRSWSIKLSVYPIVVEVLSSLPLPPSLSATSRYRHCSYPLSWKQVASNVTALENSDVITGGMGAFLIPGSMEVWLCAKHHPCAMANQHFCFVYDEVKESFVPWYPNLSSLDLCLGVKF